MTDISPDFMDLSRKVAKRFLHTVVIVDDQADFEEKLLPIARELVKPGRTGVKEENNERIDSDRIHRLDAKKVMDLFASKGMVCSILKPDEGENPLSKVEGVAKRADVFILDWEIHNDTGKIAIDIINNIIISDLQDNPRLRLIIVYTEEKNIVQISETIRNKCKVELKHFGDGFTFSHGHSHIAIFAKAGVDVPKEYMDRVLSVEELSDRLSIEFARITSGLVSNVALESIAILRDKTHLLLGQLGHEIDPPYLAHRALLPNPDYAMDHVVDIIASEIHSILENHEVGNIANLEAIKFWLKDSNKETNFRLHFPESTKEIDFETMILFFKDGFDEVRKQINKNETEDSKRLGDKSFKNFTKTFCFDGQTSDELDCKFSMLTSLKNRYEGNSNPVLTLGTIIKENSTAGLQEYWLCILPRCDCVRFEGKRNFFFLYLEEEKSNKKFDVVVQDENDNFVKLKINPKIYQSKFTHFEFEANVSNQVQFMKEGEDLILNTVDKMKCFKWISEIKREHAQRIVNNFAFEISRIGLDESEWLRRWAK